MCNLLNGKMLERNMQQSDMFEEANIERQTVKFLYGHRGESWFADEQDPSKRFSLKDDIIGEAKHFLKPNVVLDTVLFNGKIIKTELPIKMEFKVIQAPPAIRGDTAQGGVKQVTIETGYNVNVPLFINAGDIIRINTQTGEYTERVSKSSS